MELGYFAADTLGVTLYQIKGTLVANEIHPITLGPWRLDLPVDVDSDILSGTELGFWVTLGKTLHLYVVVREKQCWLFVLNKKAIRECEQATMFAGQTLKERIVEIKPAIRAAFRWKGVEWEQVEYDGATHGRGDAADLVKDRAKQGADEPVSRAQDRAQSYRSESSMTLRCPRAPRPFWRWVGIPSGNCRKRRSSPRTAR